MSKFHIACVDKDELRICPPSHQSDERNWEWCVTKTLVLAGNETELVYKQHDDLLCSFILVPGDILATAANATMVIAAADAHDELTRTYPMLDGEPLLPLRINGDNKDRTALEMMMLT